MMQYQLPSSDEELIGILKSAITNSTARKIGHEINNQLTGIFGYVSLSQSHVKNPVKAKEYLDRIMQCCETAQKLTNSVFLFSDRSLNPNPVESLRDAAEVVNLLFKTDNQVELKLDAPHRIQAPHGVREILFFAIMAVRERARRGQTILVRASETAGGPSPRLHVSVQCVSADDKTPESDAVATARSGGFCRDVRCDAARALLSKWGGDVIADLNSASPSIQMWIPFQPAASPVAARTGKPVALVSENGEKPRILLLEDQEVICDFIHDMLEDSGFEAHAYKSGSSLENALPRLDLETFDLFLLDIFVPGSSGLDVGMRIRERKPAAKLLFYSALTDRDTVEKIFPLGPATSFMPKPFKKEELLNLIHEMLSVGAA
ncbi:MAG: response regulator [bacterium]|nr:response regulator [bacterium]